MRELIPPVCLFIGLLLLCAAFAVWAFGGPVTPMSLHQAELSGDQNAIGAEQLQLAVATRNHYLLIGAFAVAGLLFAFVGHQLTAELQQRK